MPSRPLSDRRHRRHRRHDLILIAAVAASSGVLLFLLLLLALLLYLYLHRRSPTLPISVSPSRSSAPLRRFPHRLLRSATASFDPSRSLGRGASASVFRGILPDGKSVAVKRLDSVPPPISSSSSPLPPSNDREFHNELRVLSALPPSPYVVSLLGYCVEGRRRRLLVYEYMCNGSLQEALFGPRAAADLTWDRRFGIIIDVARALSFLHLECDPPVIHGDVKPSNVLLGADFQAKVSDFGLSRIKSEVAAGAVADLDPVLFSQELPPSQELLSGNSQVDFAFAHNACYSKSSKNNDRSNDTAVIGGASSPKGKEVATLMTPSPCEDEAFVGDNSRELTGYSSPLEDGRTESNLQWGRDWWWQQDGSGELCSKDYVREWIGSQICPPRNPDWDDEGKSSRLDKSEAGDETLFVESGPIANVKKQAEKKQAKGGGCSNNKQREMREWWKEEYFAEISNKGSKRSKGLKRFRVLSNREEEKSSGTKSATRRGIDSNLDISFRKGWKKKRTQSVSSDVWNGDMFSKELSSTTTSMRGTVCFIAPEFGHSMEKADIYSFGVLILVIISGRRPLHVLASPMQLERANLVSWCRQLVQGGNILDLVDEKLKDSYDKEQATLCINLALLCLQRFPELRPDSGDIVKILKGEMDLPVLPFEFSPSPPLKAVRKPRRKATVDAE